MHIILVFASTEGQTRKIMQFLQAKLAGLGAQTTLVSADAAAGMDFAPYDGVIAAASVHVGRFQTAFTDFARRHARDLNRLPSLFLPVSLAAAGDAPEDWAELGRIADRMTAETGFEPDRIEQIAGAFHYRHYGFLKYWALQWIARRKDPDATPGEDKEYTDWDRLEAILKDWTQTLDAAT